MSIYGPINPLSDDESWGGCSDSEIPSGPQPLAEFDDDSAYPTVEALQDAVNAFAKEAGYAVGRSNGKTKKGTTIYNGNPASRTSTRSVVSHLPATSGRQAIDVAPPLLVTDTQQSVAIC